MALFYSDGRRVPGHHGYRARLRARPVSVFDGADGSRWRGAVVWAHAGTDAILRVQAEHAYVRDLRVPRAMLADADCSLAIGSPCAARVEGPDVDHLVVVELRGARHEPPPWDEADMVRRGEFQPAILNASGIDGCVEFQDQIPGARPWNVPPPIDDAEDDD